VFFFFYFFLFNFFFQSKKSFERKPKNPSRGEI